MTASCFGGLDVLCYYPHWRIHRISTLSIFGLQIGQHVLIHTPCSRPSLSMTMLTNSELESSPPTLRSHFGPVFDASQVYGLWFWGAWFWGWSFVYRFNRHGVVILGWGDHRLTKIGQMALGFLFMDLRKVFSCGWCWRFTGSWFTLSVWLAVITMLILRSMLADPWVRAFSMCSCN